MIVETYSPLSLFRCCSTETVFYSSGGLSPIASCNSFFPISILSFCGRSGHSTYSNLFPISRISINILLISQLKVLDSAAEKSFSGKLRRLCSLFLYLIFGPLFLESGALLRFGTSPGQDYPGAGGDWYSAR